MIHISQVRKYKLRESEFAQGHEQVRIRAGISAQDSLTPKCFFITVAFCCFCHCKCSDVEQPPLEVTSPYLLLDGVSHSESP
jgi:hypothetical protein